MTIYHKIGFRAREYKNTALAPLVKFIKKHTELNSDAITLISAACGVFSAFFIFSNHKIFIIFILLHIFFDNLDGAFAVQEKEKKKGNRGQISDVLMDRTVGAGVLISTCMNVNSILWIILPILYILINGATIYKTFKDKNNRGFYLDFFAYVAFIFEVYLIGAVIFAFSLLLNLFFVVLKRKKI